MPRMAGVLALGALTTFCIAFNIARYPAVRQTAEDLTRTGARSAMAEGNAHNPEADQTPANRSEGKDTPPGKRSTTASTGKSAVAVSAERTASGTDSQSAGATPNEPEEPITVVQRVEATAPSEEVPGEGAGAPVDAYASFSDWDIDQEDDADTSTGRRTASTNRYEGESWAVGSQEPIPVSLSRGPRPPATDVGDQDAAESDVAATEGERESIARQLAENDSSREAGDTSTLGASAVGGSEQSSSDKSQDGGNPYGNAPQSTDRNQGLASRSSGLPHGETDRGSSDTDPEGDALGQCEGGVCRLPGAGSTGDVGQSGGSWIESFAAATASERVAGRAPIGEQPQIEDFAALAPIETSTRDNREASRDPVEPWGTGRDSVSRSSSVEQTRPRDGAEAESDDEARHASDDWDDWGSGADDEPDEDDRVRRLPPVDEKSPAPYAFDAGLSADAPIPIYPSTGR